MQGVVVEQLIRPTGLLDPEVEVRPVSGQVDDLLGEISERVKKNERVLVTTLTKRMAEDLTDYYRELGVRVRYLHSDIDTLERIDILRDLRLGEFDVLVGINLLREGLDLPEVSLVAILDADKEGFLRSPRSLIQTIGRAARNVNGRVIMYADSVTPAMKRAIDETNRRRDDAAAVQRRARHRAADGRPRRHEHQPGQRDDRLLQRPEDARRAAPPAPGGVDDMQERLAAMRLEMFAAAENLEFEKAARLRDELKKLEAVAGVAEGGGGNGAPGAFDPYGNNGKRRSGTRSKAPAKAPGSAPKNGRKFKAR